MSTVSAYLLYAVFALGGLGLIFLLPGRGRQRTFLGVLLGLAALAGLMVLLATEWATQTASNYFFVICATVAVVAGVRVITHPKPVYSAIYFVLVVVATAALMVLQSAEFLAAALIIVYAGAILVTYLFVIMLAQQPVPPLYDQSAREPFAAVLAGFVLVAVIAGRTGQALEPAKPLQSLAGDAGNTISLAAVLMTRYVVVLELAGLLLLISMVGAIALSRKRMAAQKQWPQIPLGQIGREVEPF